jgi:hypothetical protein
VIPGDGVSFTMKELLAEIKVKVDLIDLKLGAKADTARLEEVCKDVRQLERKMQTLEITGVKRNGPIADSVAENKRRIDSLEYMHQAWLEQTKEIEKALEKAGENRRHWRDWLIGGLFLALALSNFITLHIG